MRAIVGVIVACALALVVFVAQTQRAFAPLVASNQRAMFACITETGNDRSWLTTDRDRSRMRDCFYRRGGIGQLSVVTKLDVRL